MSDYKLFLIDGGNLACRLFYGAGARETLYVGNAVNNITSFLDLLKNELVMNNAVLVFDQGKSSYRLSIFPEYKGQRIADPQRTWFVELFQKVAEAYGFVTLSKEGVECDDLCASVVAAINERNKIVLVTTDKDYQQLLNRTTIIYFFQKKKFLSRMGFIKEFGIPPSYFPYLQAALGDSVDNIPKCSPAGIGMQTILKQFRLHKTLESLEHWLFNSKDTVPLHVQHHKEMFNINLNLVTLLDDEDVPDYTEENTKIATPNLEELERIKKEYVEFLLVPDD